MCFSTVAFLHGLPVIFLYMRPNVLVLFPSCLSCLLPPSAARRSLLAVVSRRSDKHLSSASVFFSSPLTSPWCRSPPFSACRCTPFYGSCLCLCWEEGEKHWDQAKGVMENIWMFAQGVTCSRVLRLIMKVCLRVSCRVRRLLRFWL